MILHYICTKFLLPSSSISAQQIIFESPFLDLQQITWECDVVRRKHLFPSFFQQIFTNIWCMFLENLLNSMHWFKSGTILHMNRWFYIHFPHLSPYYTDFTLKLYYFCTNVSNSLSFP